MFKLRGQPQKTASVAPGGDPQRLIELRSVVKTYKTPAGDFTALKNIDLKVSAGEFVAVIGKSGSGKSTLINMITGIDRPTYGEVMVGGVPIHELNEDQTAKWRGRNLGVIFQFFQLLPTLTVIENVMLPMELRQTYSPAVRKERALHYLEMVDLADQAYKFPAAISGGQKQRVAIARALINDPQVLVGDEPTGSLDTKTADSIFRLFESLVAEGRTILLVTHDRDLAGRIPRVVFINDGEITDQFVAEALPDMTRQQLAQVSSRMEPFTYDPGEVIIQQGASADSFYILVRGEVEVILDHPGGEQMLTGRLGPGQYFGEMGLLEGGKRTATVRASQDSEVVVMQLDRDSFASFIESADETRESLLHMMRERALELNVMEAMPSLRADEISGLMDHATTLTFSPGSDIVRQGGKTDYLYLITEGVADVLVTGADGQQKHVATLEPGQYFGEMEVFGGEERQATVRAAGDADVRVIQFDGDTVRRVMGGSEMTRQQISELAQKRMDELNRLRGDD